MCSNTMAYKRRAQLAADALLAAAVDGVMARCGTLSALEQDGEDLMCAQCLGALREPTTLEGGHVVCGGGTLAIYGNFGVSQRLCTNKCKGCPVALYDHWRCCLQAQVVPIKVKERFSK